MFLGWIVRRLLPVEGSTKVPGWTVRRLLPVEGSTKVPGWTVRRLLPVEGSTKVPGWKVRRLLPVEGSTKVPGWTVLRSLSAAMILLLPAFSLNVLASRTGMAFPLTSKSFTNGSSSNASRIQNLYRFFTTN